MAKEFMFRGKKFEELQKMSLNEFAPLLNARERRSVKRGLTYSQKKILEHIEKGKKNIRTHARDMVVIPQMVGHLIKVYSGKEWVIVDIDKEKLGHRLGEFAPTRKKIAHSAPGIGATRSSAALSVR